MNPPATILVVDDNTPFRLLLSAFLKKSGYETVEAEDGQKALEILAEKPTDIVLLDLQMLPVGGFTFMHEYIELGHTMPVVLVTGDPSNDILERATKLGFAGVMKKPVTEDRLIQMIHRL